MTKLEKFINKVLNFILMILFGFCFILSAIDFFYEADD